MISRSAKNGDPKTAAPGNGTPSPIVRGSIPLYFQIERILRDRLRSGHYPGSESLPAETDLCREFSVSRSTVRQAISVLQREGLIVRHAGRGSFPGQPDTTFSWQVGSVQDIFDYARETSYRLLSRLALEPPPEVAKLLDIANDTEVIQYRGVRSRGGPPFVYSITWLLKSLGEQIRVDEIRSSPIVVLIETLCGIQVAEVHQRTTAIAASREVAKILEIPVRSPILLVKRLYFSKERVPIDFAVNYFTAQRFEYSQRLTRFRA